MAVHAEAPPVLLLIAARDRDRARDIAERMGARPTQWRMLSYESHRAFPDARLFIDHSWSSNWNRTNLEALIARRVMIAEGHQPTTGSRSVIARTGE